MQNLTIPISVLSAWIVSHLIKEIIHVYKTNKFSFYTLLLETGGMPSSHSSTVSALTTSVYFLEGLTTPFWISLVFSLIVLRDAFGVRKNVSDQAHLLNKLTSHIKMKDKVEIVLGHTPLQVIIGVIIGVLVATVVHSPLFF